MPENRASAACAGLVGTLRLCQPPCHRARNPVAQCLNSSLILRVSAEGPRSWQTPLWDSPRKMLRVSDIQANIPWIATSRIEGFQQYAPR
jgi:hypothetical protein